MKEFDEIKIIKELKRINGVSIKDKTIIINSENHSCGKNAWGKISYLEKIGYTKVFSKDKGTDFDIDEQYKAGHNNKQEKQDNKINLVKMVKDRFRKSN